MVRPQVTVPLRKTDDEAVEGVTAAATTMARMKVAMTVTKAVAVAVAARLTAAAELPSESLRPDHAEIPPSPVHRPEAQLADQAALPAAPTIAQPE